MKKKIEQRVEAQNVNWLRARLDGLTNGISHAMGGDARLVERLEARIKELQEKLDEAVRLLRPFVNQTWRMDDMRAAESFLASLEKEGGK